MTLASLLAPPILVLLMTVVPLGEAGPEEDALADQVEEAIESGQKGPVLDRLYDELAATETEAAANVVATQIEALWDASGSATVDLLMDRATLAMGEGDTARAAQHLDDALRFAPDYAQGWVRRAQLYAAEDEYGEAVTALERALTADPKHYRALMALARTLDNMSLPQGAYEAYGEALAVHPYLEEAIEERRRLAPSVEGREL